ncbi:LytTR family DNA-binding domain-containing protein [Lachnospiraceae bacterium 54-53]
MLKIAVCDNDLLFIKQFKKLLLFEFNLYKTEVKIECFMRGKILLESVEKREMLYDIIFLDIDMPEINGFKVAKRLREIKNNSLLIFVTCMDNEATEGYKYNAFRYILKSRIDSDIREAVKKIVYRLRNVVHENEIIELKYLNYDMYDTVKVRKDDIIYFFIDKTRRVSLKTMTGTYNLLVRTLTYYQNKMNCNFFDIYLRSYLLNMNHIEDIKGKYFILKNGEKFLMGNTNETVFASRKKYMHFLMKVRCFID